MTPWARGQFWMHATAWAGGGGAQVGSEAASQARVAVYQGRVVKDEARRTTRAGRRRRLGRRDGDPIDDLRHLFGVGSHIVAQHKVGTSAGAGVSWVSCAKRGLESLRWVVSLCSAPQSRLRHGAAR